MTTPSRSAQFAKLHKVLKKHYKPAASSPERPVLEHLIFACLLERNHYSVAEEAFATILEEYFDWNEIRVSSVRELTETLARLHDPPATASRLKRILQHVFETSYSFDLEALHKQNLGPATEAIRKIDGASPFAVSYAVQSALGGHSIPLDAGTLEVMRILGLATDSEVESHTIAGLERAIPKSKGVEFGSLLHQLGADFTANPFAAELRAKLVEIEPEAKNRWPKRQVHKPAAAPAEDRVPKEDKHAGLETPPAATPPPKAAPDDKAAAKRKPPVKRIPLAASKPPAPKTKPHSEADAKKRTSSRLAKRKPR
jgi:endonuclease III